MFYETYFPSSNDHPFDFTWEREWRILPPNGNLPLVLTRHTQWPKDGSLIGAIIVEKDSDEAPIKAKLTDMAANGNTWVEYLGCVISLETAERKIGEREM